VVAEDGRGSAFSALVNGRPDRCVDVADRGLQYGDGLFETIAVRGGRPCLWRAHIERLSAGASRLGIPMPPEPLLREETQMLLDGQDAATLKLILTRGSGPRGYRPPSTPRPVRILLRYPVTPDPNLWPRPGVAVRLCRTRLGANPALAGIKHLNRLEQVMARAEWSDPGIAEGIMCDIDGALTCGTMTNLFLFRGSELLTPRLDRAGVAGTVRSRVLLHARELGIPCREARLSLDDLHRADGVLLTNALGGCRAVTEIDGQALKADALPADLLTRVQRDVFEPEPDW
jgi:4-amino-4-deoxychorismate lyase